MKKVIEITPSMYGNDVKKEFAEWLTKIGAMSGDEYNLYPTTKKGNIIIEWVED